jgi:hypothetical protein
VVIWYIFPHFGILDQENLATLVFIFPRFGILDQENLATLVLEPNRKFFRGQQKAVSEARFVAVIADRKAILCD